MIERKALLERVPFPSVRRSSFIFLLFLTGTCLCINTVAFLLYCTGWIRDSKQNGKVLDAGWPFDVIFAVECLLNATSDAILIVAMGTEQQHQQQGRYGGPKFAAYAMKAFIGWNTVSIVVCWCGSCALAYVREVEYEGQYSYFPRSGTQTENNTRTGNSSDSHVIPTYIVADASYSLLAVFKIAILYGVYHAYLRRLLEAHEELRPCLKTPMCTTPYDTTQILSSPQSGATAVKALFPSWGTPTVSFFRPPAEWATNPEHRNPFVEASTSGIPSVSLVAYPQPAYSLEQMGHVYASTVPKQEVPQSEASAVAGQQDHSDKEPDGSGTLGTPLPVAPLEPESSESHQLPPFFVTLKPKQLIRRDV